MSALLLCCVVGLISFFSLLLASLWVCHMFEWIGFYSMCLPCLDMAVSCNIPALPSRQVLPSPNPPSWRTQKYKEVNWTDPNCTGYGGPLISMLFLPSVNFDYGEMPVMAFQSFLSVSHSLWLRSVGGVEVLIGNCRAHCLHIHGFLDWPASGSETHQLSQTHTHM